MRSLVQYEGLCAPNCIQYCVVIIQQNNGLYSGGVPVHGRALLVVSHKSVASFEVCEMSHGKNV